MKCINTGRLSLPSVSSHSRYKLAPKTERFPYEHIDPGIENCGLFGLYLQFFTVFARKFHLACQLNLSLAVPTRLTERHEQTREELLGMLETIIVILLVLWLLGLVAGQTFGGILHVLLLVAVVVFVIRLLTGRAAV